MFRLSHYLHELHAPTPLGPGRQPPGPVVIWNLIRRCNLTCKHCYSISGDVDFPGELSTPEVFRVMDDLKAFRVPVLILSGGEPLMRRDIFEISERAKAMKFYVGLSSNGTLVDAPLADRIRDVGYDYVGISLDGIGGTHDRFRRKVGAYDEALNGLRLLRDRGIKVGVRFTMTEDNATELPRMLDLVEREGFHKFYLSHLVYAGRGNKNRGDDAMWQTTRDTMDMVIDRAWRWVQSGSDMEIVTGNNDADAVYLLHWAERTMPHSVEGLRARLVQWGGNSSGVNVANIDNLGNVHPDTMWWHYTIGNVKARSFSAIWSDLSEPIMAGLKQKPRVIGGRCGQCAYFDVCNGNTRVRAMRITGDPWAEDPGCYLSDAEIGLTQPVQRVTVSAYRGARHEAPLSL
jgi:heme d1 biosynthesis radical SAM protein NirJ